MAGRKTDSSGTHVWLVLMKAHRSIARHAARSIASLGLGLSDFAILEALLHRGPQPVNELGRRIELTSGSITTAVDRLEAGGLVTRGNAPNDRRARIVHLTPAGEARITQAFAQHKNTMDRVAANLTNVERTTLIDLLKRFGVAADAGLGTAAQPAPSQSGTRPAIRKRRPA